MIRSVVAAPITVLLLPVKVVRRVASMRLSTVLAIGAGAAVAFTASRWLMDREDAVNELPGPQQQPAARAQSSLVRWRGRLAQANDRGQRSRGRRAGRIAAGVSAEIRSSCPNSASSRHPRLSVRWPHLY